MKIENKISVIVPVYNVEKYLSRCVDSIIRQTYKNLEIILVNDGSPDNSPQICDDYAKKDTRIKVIHQENKGLSGARNTGIENATGNYIAFVDSDDWIDLDMYDKMLEVMITYKQPIVECGLMHRYEDTQTKPEHEPIITVEDNLTAMARIINNQDFAVWTRLYSREIIGDIRFKEGLISEDVYFDMELIPRLEKLVVISTPFYNYFKASESITRGPYKLKSLESIKAALFVQNFIQNEPRYSSLQKITKNFVSKMLLTNYKGINHNHKVDPELVHRKKIKKELAKYVDTVNNSPSLLIARYTPIKWYNAMVRINRNIKGF